MTTFGRFWQTGERLLRALTEMTQRYEFPREIRGKGLMIGIEFGPPRSLKLKASWHALEAARTGRFCQLITPGLPPINGHHLAGPAGPFRAQNRRAPQQIASLDHSIAILPT
jgi:hypothetical protein